MKLLICNEATDLNYPSLGFFVGWIAEFAKHCEQVTVISLGVGEYDLPGNVKVLSLGKEEGRNRIKYLYRFYKYIFSERHNYDAVFVHMNPIYVLLGGVFWKILNKKIGLWYAHVRVSALAKIASNFVTYIFSPSEASFVHFSNKINKVGHGIDTQRFKPLAVDSSKKDKMRIITIGRITPVKDLDTLIEALNILANNFNIKNFEFKIIGEPLAQTDWEYQKKLKNIIHKYDLNEYIVWAGGIPNKDTVKYYQESDIFVNLQAGGGYGKSVLEAMACGLVCIICSPVYADMLGGFAEETVFKPGFSKDLAHKIKAVLGWPPEKYQDYQNIARTFVVKNHDRDNLISKIFCYYKSE